MLGLTAVAAVFGGGAATVWLLWLRTRSGLVLTRSELLRPGELLTALQAWVSGAAIAALVSLEVQGVTADPTEVGLVARAALGTLAAWLPVALGLLVPVVRRLRDRGREPFVELSSAMAYSIALVAWFGTGRWQDAF